MKTLLIVAVFAACSFVGVNGAPAAPRPQPAPGAHHKITWAGYSYKQPGTGVDGSHWWKWCHVSASGHRVCGVWHRA